MPVLGSAADNAGPTTTYTSLAVIDVRVRRDRVLPCELPAPHRVVSSLASTQPNELVLLGQP